MGQRGNLKQKNQQSQSCWIKEGEMKAKKNTFDDIYKKNKFSEVSPLKDDKFSPNLHKWLKKNFGWSSYYPEVWDTGTSLWVGRKESDSCFVGNTIVRILCGGINAQKYYLIKENKWKNAKNITNKFWADYKLNGRCAIDKEHSVSYIDDQYRWEIKGKDRTCVS